MQDPAVWVIAFLLFLLFNLLFVIMPTIALLGDISIALTGLYVAYLYLHGM